jgi:hypothetical protein
MSPTHLHIMFNHLPIVGSWIAVALLVWGLLKRSRDLAQAGLILTVVCGVGGYGARWTGHRAEHQVEDLPWAQRELIHEHEEAADKTFIILGLAAVAAMVAMARMRGGRAARAELGVTLGLLFFGAMCAAWAGLEGGKIRHEEVRPGFVFPAGGEHDHD